MIDLTTIFYIGCFYRLFLWYGRDAGSVFAVDERFQRSLRRSGLGAVTVAVLPKSVGRACGLIAVTFWPPSTFSAGLPFRRGCCQCSKPGEKVGGLIYLTAAVLLFSRFANLSSPAAPVSATVLGIAGMTLPW